MLSSLQFPRCTKPMTTVIQEPRESTGVTIRQLRFLQL